MTLQPGKQAAASATQDLVRFVTSATVDETAIAQSVSVVLDTLAVTIAGAVEPGPAALQRALEPDARGGAVPSFWTEASYRADDAAMLFGMASHVLDYDDVSMLTVCHPSAPVLSALLAVAPRGETSGRDLLEAFAIGTEVLIRLGQAMGFRHYALGFHATATLGAVGAAAACARLMKLDEGRTRHALAIAASLSSGLRKNFGSMVKSLHVGIAAANGLRATRLAAAGVEGAAEPIEREGFLHAFSGGETDLWPVGLTLGAPFAIVEPGFEQKRYPCCYMLHKMIEATLALRREHAVALADVAAMRVEMPPGGTKPLIHPIPKSGLNGLFSAPYAVIASLADGRIDLTSFTDPAVLRPDIQARLADVTVVEVAGTAQKGSDLGSAPVTVTLGLHDGRTLSRTITASPGSRQDPLTGPQLAAKWLDCLQRAQPALAREDAQALFTEGMSLARHGEVGGWLSRLRGSAARRQAA
ncbi:MmgE/PrpD family protein [Bosea sp. (in: a-proteobacteria)]|jgi:2-methylcitrate dehydratase PrpD|uniref:MmgE/PrpD family protein n=1 Tax=Bosea sp. (in: a-proteobacteria) TaxID=1871050 RepID=UPI002DDD20E2|nr:MmgE/PrpD family protein [Bosea sp. (in: a-proteobacteria)]HEV2511510.1 MmgE/PrpD family protein [Bosea sp. (in: a-proteobacteria)]